MHDGRRSSHISKTYQFDVNVSVVRIVATESIRQKMERKKIFFTIDKDIQLLSETIIHNPYHYGSDKWANVAINLQEKYELFISPRTARERVANLFMKMRKNKLDSKTATAKDVEERKSLLLQIKTLIEQAGGADPYPNSESANESKTQDTITEPSVEMDREEFVQVFVDEKTSPWSPTNRKRHATVDEYLMIKKQEMEHELNIIKLRNENEQKMKELELQAERERAEREYKLQSLNVEKQRLEIEGENKRLLTSVIDLVAKLSKKITDAEGEMEYN